MISHTAGEDIVIVFEDKKKTKRSDQGLDLFVARIRQVAVDNGFDVSMVGTRKEVRKCLSMDFDDTARTH